MAENKFLGTIVQPFVLQGHLPHILQIVTDSNGGSSQEQTECGWRNRRLATFEKQSLKSLLSKAQNLNCCVIAKQSPATKRLCRGATSCRVLFWA